MKVAYEMLNKKGVHVVISDGKELPKRHFIDYV
ncbi:MAG: hypothetical protein ACJAZQ_002006 [Cognaticolwellia sp.]